MHRRKVPFSSSQAFLLLYIPADSEDRKKNSYLSCEQFKMKDKGTEYNLYDLSMIVQDRIDTINDLLDDVKQKKETLISFLAVLKLESGMVK